MELIVRQVKLAIRDDPFTEIEIHEDVQPAAMEETGDDDLTIRILTQRRKKQERLLGNVHSRPTLKNNVVQDEVMRFFQFASSERKGPSMSFLNFWKSQKVNYPHIALLARKICSINTTSAGVERVYSFSGHIMAPRRSRMKPTTLAKTVFLKVNKNEN